MPTSQEGKFWCPGCGQPGALKQDKYKRPYWRCYLCGVSIFMRTDMAQAGLFILQGVISKNPVRFRQAILQYNKHRMRRVQATPEKRVSIAP